MEWLISSQLIPYLLPSDYHTSTQSAFILHLLAFLIVCASPSLFLSFFVSVSPPLSLRLNYIDACCVYGWHVQSWHFRCRWLGPECPVRRGRVPTLTTAHDRFNQISTEIQKQHGLHYLMLVILLNHVTRAVLNHCTSMPKQHENMSLSHLIRYHYFLLALRPAAQLLSVYPPIGYRFCKHPLILWTFLCVCVCARIFGMMFVTINSIIHRILWELI